MESFIFNFNFIFKKSCFYFQLSWSAVSLFSYSQPEVTSVSGLWKQILDRNPGTSLAAWVGAGLTIVSLKVSLTLSLPEQCHLLTELLQSLSISIINLPFHEFISWLIKVSSQLKLGWKWLCLGTIIINILYKFPFKNLTVIFKLKEREVYRVQMPTLCICRQVWWPYSQIDAN